MRKVVIDINIYSNAFRGEKRAMYIMKHYEKILISPVVIAELMTGFKRGTREKENREQLMRFLARDRVIEIPVTSETSAFYALIVTNLKEKGTPVPTNDIWLAAQAMENGAAMATGDSHFKKIPGIILV